MEQEDFLNLLNSMHELILRNCEHIKKYKRIRKLESEVTSKLAEYVTSGKYNVQDTFDAILDYEDDKLVNKILPDFELLDNDSDFKILCELSIYPNHPKLKSATDIYLENKKFRSAEKIKMLESLKNSFVGLFQVINVDSDQGFVFLKDLFTGKEFKIVDIKFSIFPLDKINDRYLYNRIITYDGISFGTGIDCTISLDNKELKTFLETYKHKKCSDFLRCIVLYAISKNEKKSKIKS